MIKIILTKALALSSLFLMQMSNAQQSVVVIPLAGDNVAMAQQHFRYDEAANTTGTHAYMCDTDVFNTPSQATQVLLIGNASASFTLDGASWLLKVQFTKNQGSWLTISTNRSWTGASSSNSQISTTDILDLDPDSSYQFRLHLDASTNTFNSGTTEYCELVVSASYKLPDGKNILEVTP